MSINIPNATKLVILGHTGVGKTSLALRFTQGEFVDCQLSTIGAQCITKSVELPDNQINFAIWDTAGQERFHSLAPIYYRNARAAIVVYDITQKQSYEIAQRWVEEMQQQGDKKIIISLVGNKSDLSESREVKMKIAQQYAQENNLLFLETSAKTGEHVEDLFFKIAEMIPDSNPPTIEPTQKTNELKTITLGETLTPIITEKKKTGCC
ncbi:ras-related protein rabf2b [Anaeramoeba ignava]|uniref:Ras-related protein rabf2b n=1 Tax=Anaeramoeba ignava TaxID=1746090 RepID=A0A9Q0LHM3_ANAIG|nr:ras-related protein rabf2b [Anaeramoeba ignava]